MLLGGIGVAAVHHECGRQLGGSQFFAGGRHTGCIVIGRFAAAQNDMAIGVAVGLHHRYLAVFVY